MSTCYIDGTGTTAADRVTVEALAADQQDVADLCETVGLEARHACPRAFGLAVDASHAALASSGLEPQDIDLIVQVSRMRVEYFSWGLSMAVAKELGHTTTPCLDVTEWSGPSLVAGLRLLDAKFRTNDRLRTALLHFPHRFSDFVDLETPENRWLWPLSDGRRRASAPPRQRSRNPARTRVRLRRHRCTQDRDAHGGSRRRPRTRWLLPPRVGLGQVLLPARPRRLAVAVRGAGYRAARGNHRASRGACRSRARRPGRRPNGLPISPVAERLRQRLGLGPRLRAHNAHGMMGGAELAFALQRLMTDPALRGTRVTLAGFGLPAHFGALIAAL